MGMGTGKTLVAFMVMLGVVIVLSLAILPDTKGTVWLAMPIGGLFVLLVSGVSLAVAKREVFDNRIGGPVMRSFGHISVDRKSTRLNSSHT